MLIAQITDCHVVDRGELFVDRVDSAAALRRAVDAIGRLDPVPDVVLATGDLVNDGRTTQYDHLMELLADLDVPVIAAMGNHDDRGELRRRFGLPGSGDEPIDYVVDGYDVRFVVLDTTIPGEHRGRLTDRQIAWLDARLSDDTRPTVVVQHHPPFLSGIASMDDYGLEGSGRQAATLARHHHVEAVVAGHVHRAIVTRFGGTVASCWPSTAAQVTLDLTGGATSYTSEPAGFALHRWTAQGGLISHLVPLVDSERWTPSWALADADGTDLGR